MLAVVVRCDLETMPDLGEPLCLFLNVKVVGLEAALDESNIRVHDQTQELDRLMRRTRDLESVKYEQTASLHILESENKALKRTRDEQV